MRGWRLQWQLFAVFSGLALILLLGLNWFYSDSLRQFYRQQTAGGLESVARVAGEQISDPLRDGRTGLVREICRRLARDARLRITVILPSGRVVADSSEDPSVMDNHGDRPEILAAYASGTGISERFSHTLGKNMLYVAVTLPEADGAGVIRVAVPETVLDRTLFVLFIRFAMLAAALLVLIPLVCYLIARRVSRPLEDLTVGARLFAEGRLNYRLHVPESLETRRLAGAMNAMAGQLSDRLDTIRRQRNEIEAILFSMEEGTLAVDSERRVITINEAASRLFGRKAEDVQGRPVQEGLRNPGLQKFIAEVFAGEKPLKGEIVLHGDEERVLLASGTVLRGAGGRNIGVLVVLHDVTHMRRLENMRRDFVANVSHELRTPVTSIMGFSETLLEGRHDPEEVKRFLEIILRQASRLNCLIEDILNLSSLEKDVDEDAAVLETASVENVILHSVDACRMQADRRRVEIEAVCPVGLEASINSSLLEQALINLLDNAVKYSHEGGKIKVEVEGAGPEIIIRVIDKGIGIEREHLPRLFERFYRVDKARSREDGGTGLGLAIVKHVMLAHHGRVSVESTPGKGSVFSLYLPAGNQSPGKEQAEIINKTL